jgi:hypothetical protein
MSLKIRKIHSRTGSPLGSFCIFFKAGNWLRSFNSAASGPEPVSQKPAGLTLFPGLHPGP